MNKIEYKISVGCKATNEILRKLDLGFNAEEEGVITETLIAELTTKADITEDIIKKHKKGLRQGLSKYYFVGDIKAII